ncbi:hypothetical protein ASE36_18530 [Rhizobium sp. Root274]|uniref:hypothetical protein n=1 Tax=unclassified Rhizobium TaxID=2613769 RepID=UPI0007124051|nr:MULTISPECIES: hypothetical protein [unclassified Rhizobium]KQW27584.1 hypothetical protein ASC71_18565 [Rhizobium sp. Root1240]KRD27822.1 hypothetical protein ASE36_18530 [Rhizobium sp. Root274]
MQNGAGGASATEETPLLSHRFLLISVLVIALLALASLAINIYGRLYGAQLAFAGHSDSLEVYDITIGRDLIHLTANTIRFEPQRRTGATERVDLQLHWPSMEGYSHARRLAFDDIGQVQPLIFLQISQSTMSRDMSGRVEPIYRHLLTGPTEAAPAGLQLHHFKPGTGFEGEVLLTGEATDGGVYAIRCLIPTDDKLASSSDCQRDIHAGEDLSVLYRFSSRLLPDWKQIDDAVRSFVEQRAEAAHPVGTTKKP